MIARLGMDFLLVRAGGRVPLRVSSICDFGDEHHQQAFRRGGLDGGGVFCGGRRPFVARWSRSEIRSRWDLRLKPL
jgi:hypothetical protein